MVSGKSDAPGSSVKAFTEQVLIPLGSEVTFTASQSHFQLQNKDQSCVLDWLQEAEGRSVAIKLLSVPPTWETMTTDWVGWAKYLRRELNARLLLVVTEGKAGNSGIYAEPGRTPRYDPDEVKWLLRLMLARPDEGLLSTVDTTIGLNCFWLVYQSRIITVSFVPARQASI